MMLTKALIFFSRKRTSIVSHEVTMSSHYLGVSYRTRQTTKVKIAQQMDVCGAWFAALYCISATAGGLLMLCHFQSLMGRTT